jgi:hypothetical protein
MRIGFSNLQLIDVSSSFEVRQTYVHVVYEWNRSELSSIEQSAIEFNTMKSQSFTAMA